MKTHTSKFKEEIKKFGRQLDSKITYTIDNEEVELGQNELNSITPHYEGGILKSVMKQLDIDSNVEIPVGTEVNYQFGVKTRSGKNIFDEAIEVGRYNIDNGEKDAVSTAYRNVNYISVVPQETYTFSINSVKTNLTFRWFYYDSNKNFLSTNTSSNGNFTTPANCYYVNWHSTALKTSYPSGVSNSMIEKGTTATTYEEAGTYEYLDFGNYIVKDIEKQEDLESWKITCYDKMLYAMKPYEKMNITYPITIRNYINAICSKLGLTFANASSTFANYDKQIQHELYLSYNDTTHDYTDDMGYTFRDVLDELAQATGSTICINDSDELEVRYITDTEDTIDEEYLKDVNVNFGKKYGKVNSIVLSRAGGSDRVYLRDEESVTENGLCEINISENQIMNFNDRSDYLPDLLEQLDGLEYYINDFTSTGICYYDLCDRYNVQIGNETYSCVMFNDEILVTQGLQENIYTDMPEQSETDYTKADKTDRKINQTYIIVDKQNQVIESVVSTVDEQNDKISQITQTVDQIESQITDIPTITTESEGTGSLYLSNLMNMKLISLRIHPTDRDILGLFATPLLKASTTLKSLSRGITFDNTDGEKEDLYYKLPDNLYYYDSETYDEFFYDGKEERIYVIRKVEVDEYGNKSILDTPITEEYEYQDLVVEEGNYNVFMSTYPTAYIYVKAMIKNDYTDLFATNYEVDSKITQTADTINLEVSNKVDNEDYNGANIMLKINSDESQAQINADKISLAGKTIQMTSDNIAINSTNFQVDKNGNITANNATLNSGTFKGNVNTSQDCYVGNNLYVGQNQNPNVTSVKSINFTNDVSIDRIIVDNDDILQITIEDAFKVTKGLNSLFNLQNGYFRINNLDGEYIEGYNDTIYMSHQPTWPSDKRLKQEIKDINVNWIDELKVKEFEYIKNPDKKQIGLIAQDYEDKEYNKYFLNKNDDGYYGISYGNITNALIQYCQEMKKEINSLKEEIKKLKESDK